LLPVYSGVTDRDQPSGALERAALRQFLVSPMLSVPFVFDPAITLVAFIFSAAMDGVFGYFPARKATCLSPIDLFRHE